MRGIYITSTLEAVQMDGDKNVGFVIEYCPGKEDISTTNTRSLNSSSADAKDDAETAHVGGSATGQSVTHVKNTLEGAFAIFTGGKYAVVSRPRFLAFKALSVRSSLANVESQTPQEVGEKELIKFICYEIDKAIIIGEGTKADVSSHDTTTTLIEDRDIISITAAKKSKGLLEVWGHPLKKILWA